MPRLFTAVEIPKEIGESLAMLRGGLPGARWIDPENYHLTLRFIGDIDDRLARDIAFMLGDVDRPPFELRRALWSPRSAEAAPCMICRPSMSG